MEATPGKDAVKTVKMTTKNLEDYIKLVAKAAARFVRTEYNFERNSTVVKCYETTSHATEKFL